MKENIVETKICKHCASSFEITDKDLEFYEKVSPVFPQNWELSNKNWEIRKLIKPLSSKFSALNSFKYLIPTPTLCPDCRFIRRASFRNLRYLYKRNCDATWKQIISIYSPDKPYKVYEPEFWRSDRWDTMDYGIDFDFSRSFFKQFKELLYQVPKIALSTEKLENSKYVNYSWWIKNCYLVFISAYDEDCYYSYWLRYSKSCLDCSYSQYLENCYEVSDSLNCKNSFYITNSKDCNNCYYSDNLIGSEFCLFSANLVNKKYFLLNQEIWKQDFENILKDINNNKDILNDYLVMYKDLCLSVPKKCNYNILSENCFGEYILNSKSVFNGFDLSEVYDCKYVDWLFESKDCYDVYDWWETAERCYECYKIWKWVSNTIFSAFCISNINNLIYCYDCVNNCSNCFWCVWLKNKSYCILNKQYTKEEYEKLVPKIIEHMMKTWEWWEFFPSSISPFWYNETVAQEYFPLNRFDVIPADAGIYSKEKVIKGNNDSEMLISNNSKEDSKNFKEFIDSWSSQEWQTTSFLHWPIFNRSEYESPKPKVDKIIPASKLPEDIKEIPDDILNWAIECEITKKPFRIIKEELEFYRKHNLPIPKRHPDQRHLDRMKLRNPRKLYDRLCDCEKCEENNKKAWTFKQEEFALKDPELNSGWQRRKIKTTYSPDRPEIVYCEECYNKEVY